MTWHGRKQANEQRRGDKQEKTYTQDDEMQVKKRSGEMRPRKVKIEQNQARQIKQNGKKS